MKTTTTPGLRPTSVNLKKTNWDRFRQEVGATLSKHSLPTDCQIVDRIFRTVLLKAASHHIPTGWHRLHEEPVPEDILDVMTRRDDLHKRDPTSHELPRLNYDIQNRIYAHKRQILRPWIRRQMSPSCGELLKELMTEQNARQRTKLLPSMEARPSSLQPGSTNSSTRQSCEDTSWSETRLVTRETKRKSLEVAQAFTTDLVRRAIKSCRNSKTFGPDKLSIFHLKHLGPRAI